MGSRVMYYYRYIRTSPAIDRRHVIILEWQLNNRIFYTGMYVYYSLGYNPINNRAEPRSLADGYRRGRVTQPAAPRGYFHKK